MKLRINKILLGLTLTIAMISLSGCGSTTQKEGESISVENNIEEKESKENSDGDEEIVLENDAILLNDENFSKRLDDIFESPNEYVGIQIRYEGFVYMIDDIKEDIYVVGRKFELEHGDHVDETVIGFPMSYGGTWPALNTWVEVTGVIEMKSINGTMLPSVRVSKLKVMEERGQEKVTD